MPLISEMVNTSTNLRIDILSILVIMYQSFT